MSGAPGKIPLKYQSEIDNFNLDIICPEGVFSPDPEIDAYRFSFSPIQHELNFLPNVLFDRKINYPFDYAKASSINKCKRCGASYFTNQEGLRRTWSRFSDRIKEIFGYTHVAYGKLNKKDGLMRTPGPEGHFGFYEYSDTQLASKFVLIEEL